MQAFYNRKTGYTVGAPGPGGGGRRDSQPCQKMVIWLEVLTQSINFTTCFRKSCDRIQVFYNRKPRDTAETLWRTDPREAGQPASQPATASQPASWEPNSNQIGRQTLCFSMKMVILGTEMLILLCVFKDLCQKVVIWLEVLTESGNFTRCF